MPGIVWIVIIVVVIIGLIILLRLGGGGGTSEEPSYEINDEAYRDYVYKVAKPDFKPYLLQLHSNIDAINALRQRSSKLLSQESYSAMREIYSKADAIEKKINDYWNSSRFEKDFYYYIGLHYTSHLLGDAIKQEQKIIKDSFVECKEVQRQWGEKIDTLKYRQQRTTGKQKAEISQEIRSCCETHKQISTLASKLGGTNTKYHERVTEQFKRTAERRDFIADNFGKRGRDWKDRMSSRTKRKKRR